MKLFTISAILLIISFTSYAKDVEVSPEKRIAIHNLLVKLNALEAFNALTQAQMPTVIAAIESDLKYKLSKSIANKISLDLTDCYRNNFSTLEDRLILIYNKYYSLEDIEKLNDFYESPLGARLLETQPYILNESMVAGGEWGTSLLPEIGRIVKQNTPIKVKK